MAGCPAMSEPARTLTRTNPGVFPEVLPCLTGVLTATDPYGIEYVVSGTPWRDGS
jgi:hypothetical protein